MPLRETLSNTWDHVQGFLFPMLREEAGPLSERHERLVVVLEVAGVEAFVQSWEGLPGRPLKDRHALARAFVAKAVFGLPTTSALIERLSVDAALRRLCGWERAGNVPCESTFSRAFADFALRDLLARAHAAPPAIDNPLSSLFDVSVPQTAEMTFAHPKLLSRINATQLLRPMPTKRVNKPRHPELRQHSIPPASNRTNR